MDKDRQTAKEQVKNLPFGEKVKHYLYYYKFHIIIVAVVLALAGLYMYQRVTKTESDLSISVFTKEYIPIEAEENAEKVISDWLTEEKAKTDEEGFITQIGVTSMPKATGENAERLSAAYTKLDGQLATGEEFAFIFDEETYNTLMSVVDYYSIKFDEFSGEIGDNAKKALGLGTDIKYYYVTRILYSSEQDNSEAIAKQQYAMQLYLKIKELN